MPTDTYDVYLCDTPALFAFFTLWHRNAGGFTDVYFSRNVWLRPSHVERDRLVGPSGSEAAGDRTLTYFVAHEITHVMESRRLGRLGYYRPRGGSKRDTPTTSARVARSTSRLSSASSRPASRRSISRRSGLYLRYHLLVAELIDHQGMTPDALLSHAIDAAPIEKALGGAALR